MDAILKYIAMRQAQPLKGLGDSVHQIHTGTEFEAELRFSDLETVAATISRLTELRKALERARPFVAFFDNPYVTDARQVLSVIDAALATPSDPDADGGPARD